jgi:hypothetical protein
MVDGVEPTDDPLRVDANGSIPVWLANSTSPNQ